MNKIHIVTVATESKYYFPYLIESCKKNNIELTILGFGEKWKGFNWRFNLMREFLRKLPPDDIVCFVDGYDVICTRNLNELKDNFINIKNKTQRKIITGYHRFNSYIVNSIAKSRFKGDINAGTYIGECKDLLDMFKNISNTDNSSDDQELLNKYNNENVNIIHIDKDEELFGTSLHIYPCYDISKFYTVENNKIYTKKIKKQPFFIHGPNNANLSVILEKLNYNPDKTITRKLKQEYKDKVVRIVWFDMINIINKSSNIISRILILILIIVIFFVIHSYLKTTVL